jgi:hypothetical protein
MHPPIPNQAALLLNTVRIQPGTPCTWQPCLARTAPGPPQESLVRNETRTSLTRTTLGPIVGRPTDLPVAAGYTEPGANPESLMAQLAPPRRPGSYISLTWLLTCKTFWDYINNWRNTKICFLGGAFLLRCWLDNKLPWLVSLTIPFNCP